MVLWVNLLGVYSSESIKYWHNPAPAKVGDKTPFESEEVAEWTMTRMLQKSCWLQDFVCLSPPSPSV